MRFPQIGTRSLVIAMGIAVAAVPAAAQRPTREHSVVVSVLDRSGNVAAGLTPADVVVREDGFAREVTGVAQVDTPVQVAVLVDTSANMQLTLRDVRLGVDAFARALWTRNPESEVSLMEFGQRPHVMVPFTQNALTLKEGLDRLVENTGSGAYALDAIVEAARALRGRAVRPVIVVFSREGSPEFSTRQSGAIEAAVKDAGASLWTFVLREGMSGSSSETLQRDIVLGDVAGKTGGAREILLDRMSIQREFERLAERLASQYVVSYARPDSLIPPTRLEVTSRRSGTRVLAPRWLAP